MSESEKKDDEPIPSANNKEEKPTLTQGELIDKRYSEMPYHDRMKWSCPVNPLPAAKAHLLPPRQAGLSKRKGSQANNHNSHNETHLQTAMHRLFIQPESDYSKILRANRLWNDPNYIAQQEESDRIREANKLQMLGASSVTPETTSWIIQDWLAQDEVTGLVGVPGSGKTTFYLTLAAAVSQGRGYQLGPGLSPMGGGFVLIFNAEDSIAKTLVPRLIAAGANLDKVRFYDFNSAYCRESPFAFFDDDDIERLVTKAKTEYANNVGLIVLDPVYFAVKGDAEYNHKVREACLRLAVLAKRMMCAVLIVSHSVKHSRGKDALDRVAGPAALRQEPRSIILLNKISNGPSDSGGTHVIVHAKNNIGRINGGFEYRIRHVDIDTPSGPLSTVKFEISNELHGSAEDILRDSECVKAVENMTKLGAAVKFLEDILKDGPRLRIEIEEAAKESDVKFGTLMNAKEALNILTNKRKGDGRSVWRLPSCEVDELPRTNTSGSKSGAAREGDSWGATVMVDGQPVRFQYSTRAQARAAKAGHQVGEAGRLA